MRAPGAPASKGVTAVQGIHGNCFTARKFTRKVAETYLYKHFTRLEDTFQVRAGLDSGIYRCTLHARTAGVTWTVPWGTNRYTSGGGSKSNFACPC